MDWPKCFFSSVRWATRRQRSSGGMGYHVRRATNVQRSESSLAPRRGPKYHGGVEGSERGIAPNRCRRPLVAYSSVFRWCGSQEVRHRFAKPTHVGSNPIRTSSSFDGSIVGESSVPGLVDAARGGAGPSRRWTSPKTDLFCSEMRASNASRYGFRLATLRFACFRSRARAGQRRLCMRQLRRSTRSQQ